MSLYDFIRRKQLDIKLGVKPPTKPTGMKGLPAETPYFITYLMPPDNILTNPKTKLAFLASLSSSVTHWNHGLFHGFMKIDDELLTARITNPLVLGNEVIATPADEVGYQAFIIKMMAAPMNVGALWTGIRRIKDPRIIAKVDAAVKRRCKKVSILKMVNNR